MSIPGSASPLFFTAAADAAAFQVDRSLRFDDASNGHLRRTPSTAGNRKTWTLSFWIKRTEIGGTQYIFNAGNTSNGDHSVMRINSDQFQMYQYGHGGDTTAWSGGNGSQLRLEAKFRDPSAWMHIVVAMDTTQATQSDRLKYYVNGVEQTDFSSTSYPVQNSNPGYWNAADMQCIGGIVQNTSPSGQSDYYLAEVHMVDGTQLAASDFGEYDDNNVWQPKAYSGSYGTNGFYLKFDDNSSAAALGNDSSGNDNDFTVHNFSVTAGAGNDSLLDTPMNYEADSGENGGNYCTWNPLDMETGVITLSEGNLKTITNSSTGDNVRGTFGFSSGKWYWECTVTDFSGGFDIGFATPEWDLTAGDVGAVANSWSVSDSGASKAEGTVTSGAITAFNSTGKVIGIAFDADAGSVKYFIDGTDEGVVFSGLDTSYTYMPAIYLRVATTGGIWNFGQRGSFTYDPPSGYKGLCSTNLPDPTIADGSTAMDVVLYSGTGSSQTVGSLNFSPDLAWMKQRSGSRDHMIHDTVRGNNEALYPSQDYAEATVNGVTFGSTGFTLSTDSHINQSSNTYVAWAWDAGTSTVSNTDGSITSSVRANPSAGFSIVSYSGSGSNGTIGHGLNAAPSLIITKCRNTANIDWIVYSPEIDDGKILILNGTNAQFTGAGGKYGTVGSSTYGVVKQTNFGNLNASGSTYIAYCFTPVAGYSAFGSYTGSGSDDGSYVFLGFRPAFLMIKRTDAVKGWMLIDSTRNPNNVIQGTLYPHADYAEFTGSGHEVDFLSNGFKCRKNNDRHNASGGTYIYAAFAEHPFKTARAR